MTSNSLRRIIRHLPVLLRGRPLHGAERYRPFFIVGAGRSGTTLLRAMLEAHPDVHIPPESALRPVMMDYRRYSRLPWNVVLRIVLSPLEYHAGWEPWDLPFAPLFHELNAIPGGGRHLAAMLDALYRAHAQRQKPTATRWGDKTPLNTSLLPALRAVFPDLRVVHLLRDGRDVVQSFMRFRPTPLSREAGRWLRAVRTAGAFGARHPVQYVQIRYEELVRQPRATMQGLATFLNLAFDERMLRHHEIDLRLTDIERYPHLQGVWKPVHQQSVGRWRTAFDAAQLTELDRLLGPTLAELGYGGPP